MMIMSQDRLRFVIVGRGTAIGAWDDNGTATIFCTFGQRDEDDIILGKYNNMEIAKRIVQEIYSAIEDQSGNYKMPSAKKADNDERERPQWEPIVDSKETPLYTAGLSTRTYNCLKRKGLYTIEQVRRTPESNLLEIRGMGEMSFHELIDKGIIQQDE